MGWLQRIAPFTRTEASTALAIACGCMSVCHGHVTITNRHMICRPLGVAIATKTERAIAPELKAIDLHIKHTW